MPAPRYSLIAIDLDGTLLDHSGHASDRNVAAIHAARAAGITVTLCTGRAFIECEPVINRINQTDPIIVSGGALVSCPVTGRTLERFTLDQDLIARITAHLQSRGHISLILKDPDAAGYDYLAISKGGAESLDPASRWWFDHMGVRVRYVPHLDDDEHPEHSVRIGAYAANRSVAALADELRANFGGEAMLQHFNGVMLPKERKDEGVDTVHIVELFHPNADKWQALERLATRLEIPVERTAAIGDQTNDLSMITHAGLGIAMANADPAVLAVAKRHTLHTREDGVAHAIEKMLSGEW